LGPERRGPGASPLPGRDLVHGPVATGEIEFVAVQYRLGGDGSRRHEFPDAITEADAQGVEALVGRGDVDVLTIAHGRRAGREGHIQLDNRHSDVGAHAIAAAGRVALLRLDNPGGAVALVNAGDLDLGQRLDAGAGDVAVEDIEHVADGDAVLLSDIDVAVVAADLQHVAANLPPPPPPPAPAGGAGGGGRAGV